MIFETDLGRNWSPKIDVIEGQKLVTDGVYRTLRHPIYAGMWLWGLAQPLLIHNWIAGFALLVTFTPLYLLRACQICGASHEKEMICHEVRVYDDNDYTATLTNFMLVCPDCSFIMHIGGSGTGSVWGGELSDEQQMKAFDHMMRVNSITFEEALNVLVEANHIWDRRSQHGGYAFGMVKSSSILRMRSSVAELTRPKVLTMMD